MAVALLTASLMSTELLLTRIFSVVVWYHFAFFAISVALFGTGVASLYVHVRQSALAPEQAREQLGRAALVLAAVILGVDVVLVHVTPDWFAPGSAFTHVTFKLVALFVLAAAPFLVGGFALSLAMTRFSSAIHELYFWDLAGAGAACVLVVPLLGLFGGPVALVLSALLAAGAAMTFATSAGEQARGLRTGSRLAVGGLAVLSVVLPMTGLLDIRFARGIRLADVAPELNRWNSFSMVTVSPVNVFRGWGISPAYRGQFPEQKSLVIDMNALTPITRFSGNFEDVGYATHDLSALVYRLKQRPERVCVIGAGGGKDVLAALASGAQHVTAVEINPLIVNDVMKGAYRDYTGGLYLRDDVTAVVDDGRSYVRRSTDRYDVLLLSMVDTSAATAAGAYALTENSLYTVEAFEDFTSRLRDGGVLSVSSVSMKGLATGARLVSIARTALLGQGADPARSVFVVATPWLHTPGAVLYDVLVKPSGFSPAELATLSAAARELAFPVVYPTASPAHPEAAWITAILTTRDEAALAADMARWPQDVSPTTDDRPFFFYQNRFADLAGGLSTDGLVLFGNGLAILARVAVIAFVLVLAFLLFPLFFGRKEITRGTGAPGWDVAYVASLGLGFMFVEIALIQRFALYLGNPVYSLAVVLLAILVGGALGSRVLARGEVSDLGGRLLKSLVALLVYVVVLALALGPLFAATTGWSGSLRAVVAAALLLPLGFLLGAPFPAGLRAIGLRAESRIPWLWAINSATSVLASIAATTTSLHLGISASLWIGAAIYLAALALSRVVLRPAG